MHKPELLDTLLNRGAVWRGGDRCTRFGQNAVRARTGVEHLDRELQGGWPHHTGIELCVPHFAVEWHLLTQQLARITEDGQIGVLINPPHALMAARLMSHQVCLSHVWIIHTHGNNDFVAATCECLRTHRCGLVAAWEPKNLQYVHLRKCMMAGAESNGLFFLVRRLFARRNSSPARLRLMLTPRHDCVEVEIFKHQGLIEPKRLHLDLPPHMQPRVPTRYLGAGNPLPAKRRRRPQNLVRFTRTSDST